MARILPIRLLHAQAAAEVRPSVEFPSNQFLKHADARCYDWAVRPVLIFDLDGTLVDSKKDLTTSVNHIRNRFDLPVLAEEEIARFIGNGALALIRCALAEKASEINVQAALQMFLSYYKAHMLDSTDLYPGVRETLDRLSDCRLAVLTNKPVHFSCAMLDGLGIYKHFVAVYGGNSFDQKKPDPVGVSPTGSGFF